MKYYCPVCGKLSFDTTSYDYSYSGIIQITQQTPIGGNAHLVYHTSCFEEIAGRDRDWETVNQFS